MRIWQDAKGNSVALSEDGLFPHCFYRAPVTYCQGFWYAYMFIISPVLQMRSFRAEKWNEMTKPIRELMPDSKIKSRWAHEPVNHRWSRHVKNSLFKCWECTCRSIRWALFICNQSYSAENMVESEHWIQDNVRRISKFSRIYLVDARISCHC